MCASRENLMKNISISICSPSSSPLPLAFSLPPSLPHSLPSSDSWLWSTPPQPARRTRIHARLLRKLRASAEWNRPPSDRPRSVSRLTARLKLSQVLHTQCRCNIIMYVLQTKLQHSGSTAQTCFHIIRQKSLINRFRCWTSMYMCIAAGLLYAGWKSSHYSAQLQPGMCSYELFMNSAQVMVHTYVHVHVHQVYTLASDCHVSLASFPGSAPSKSGGG